MSPLAVFAVLLAEAAAPRMDPGPYVIGPEDILAIHVWKEPEISRKVPVRPDGRISLPLIHDIQAAGLTPAQLASALTAAFKVHLTDPEVAVVVDQIHSKKFHVMGEVLRPGSYPLLGPTTILQALSAAGGFREFADTKNIQLIRGERRYRFDYNSVLRGRKLEHNVHVQPGDTLLVP
jgi:polysaccharide export outer membrane protein